MKAAVLAGLVAALLLDGCASQVLSIRTVPDQTPAADNAAAAANAAAFSDAVAAESANSSAEAQDAPPLLTPADALPMYTYDPWERSEEHTSELQSRP